MGNMKPASLIRPGIRADEMLKMRGRSAQWAVQTPTLLGTDEERMVIAWHYVDCDVILHYRNNCYRVREVSVVAE